MPPKKKEKKKQEPLIDYDVNKMNTADLKAYAAMLEKEIEAFRDFCSFYRQTEVELASVFKTRQDQIQEMNNNMVEEDIEVEKLNLQVQQKLEMKEQERIYKDFVNDKRKKARNFELDERLIENKFEQEQLEAMLAEEESRFEAERRKMQTEKKVALEKNSSIMRGKFEHEKGLWDKSLKDIEDKLAETNEYNNLALNPIVAEASEAKRNSENRHHEICQSYQQKLKDYYKNVTRKDLDVIKELERKAAEIKSSIESTKQQIKRVRQEFEDLGTGGSKVDSSDIETDQLLSKNETKNKFYSKNNKQKEILKKENQVLENKIKVLEEQTTNLRDQFTRILEKVRQIAEMRANLLEKKLNSYLNDSDDENSGQIRS